MSEKNPFGFAFFTSSSLELEHILWILAGVAALAFAAFYGSYLYQRWRRFREFENEMKTLELNPEQEGTLASMVKRYQIGEPIRILYSAKLFDDMAVAEMRRILSSQGSAASKEKFINAIYEIRTKTYHPDWVGETGEPGMRREA